MVEMFGEKMYTIDDVIKTLGVSRETAFRMFRTGKLNGIQLKHTWYISEKNIQKFLNAEE